MRQIFCFIAITIVIILANAGNAFAQNQAEGYYKNGKLIEIKDLLWGEENCSESYKRYAGTVSSVQLTGGGQIDNFTLKTAKGAVKIYLSPSLYAERLSKADANALPKLIAKGKRITVDTQRCGGSKKIVTAAYIIAGIHLDVLG